MYLDPYQTGECDSCGSTPGYHQHFPPPSVYNPAACKPEDTFWKEELICVPTFSMGGTSSTNPGVDASGTTYRRLVELYRKDLTPTGNSRYYTVGGSLVMDAPSTFTIGPCTCCGGSGGSTAPVDTEFDFVTPLQAETALLY